MALSLFDAKSSMFTRQHKGAPIVEREFFEIDVSMKVVKQTSRHGSLLD